MYSTITWNASIFLTFCFIIFVLPLDSSPLLPSPSLLPRLFSIFLYPFSPFFSLSFSISFPLPPYSLRSIQPILISSSITLPFSPLFILHHPFLSHYPLISYSTIPHFPYITPFPYLLSFLFLHPLLSIRSRFEFLPIPSSPFLPPPSSFLPSNSFFHPSLSLIHSPSAPILLLHPSSFSFSSSQ